MWSSTERRKRASWRRTWTGTGDPGADTSLPLTVETDTGPRASWSYSQSPHSPRHTLDLTPLRDYASACISKLSRSRNRMSFNSSQDHELVSPTSSGPLSPRLPGSVTADQHMPQSGDDASDQLPAEAESIMEGVQVIRADIEPIIHTLYESSTERYQYLVADPTTKDAIIIDPVLDRNSYAPGINTTAADQILYLVRQHNYHVVRILETHSIQEHPTSAWYLRTQLRDSSGQMPRICTGKAIAGVQRMFARQYGVQDAGWAARFDSFQDGQVFVVGQMRVQCLHLLTQPDWFGFIIGHNVFLGKEISKDLTESAAVRPTLQIPLRKLSQYANNYAFHPQKSDELSRPSTAQTEVSQWDHDPVTPRVSLSMRRMISRQHGSEDQNPFPSRTSSRQSNRRISQIPELA